MYGLSNEIIEKIRTVGKNNNIKIMIFGSRAKGNYKENSDIDIAIIEEVSESKKYKIMDEIDQINCEYKIDIVFIQNIKNEKFLNSIKQEGKIL